nr:PQQ-binding-like beta-propeller repeat protein [Oceanococcus sp. HetDA_MAG_MS8]
MHHSQPGFMAASGTLSRPSQGLRRWQEQAWGLALLSSISYALAAQAEWPLYGGDAAHHRHVLNSQISPENIHQLKPAWSFKTGIKGSFQATPIVADGVMYVSLPWNHVVALNAASGEEIWRYQHRRDMRRKPCCGPANRGVALAQGRVLMGTVDGHLLALDAANGELLWDRDVTGGDAGIAEDIRALGTQATGKVVGTSGAGLNMAPTVHGDKVIIGITGVGYGLHLDNPRENAPLGAVVGIAGHYGRRGFIAAYSLSKGEPIWQFDTIPEQGWEGDFVQSTADGERLPRNPQREKAQAPSYSKAWRYGGGSVWSTPVIDTATDTLFFGTGNPSPQMQGSSRPGDNLYTSSVVALDVNTGTLRWHYQQVPHDLWGYDVASPPVLFHWQQGDKSLPAVGQAGKTGWFYVLNRDNGELLYKSEPFVPQHNMFKPPSAEGTIVYPGVIGGSNWSPVSVDAQRRKVFIAGIHWPVEYRLHTLPASEEAPALQYSSMSPVYDAERYGLISALDLDSGRVLWQQRTSNPLIGGLLSTDSGLVFSGEGGGALLALAAETGAKLWESKTPFGVNAPPISYEVDGRQHIAVVSGGNALFGYAPGDLIQSWALATPAEQ